MLSCFALCAGNAACDGYVARSARYEIGRHLTPLCVPLRALGWGYDCFALRALSLRDDCVALRASTPPMGAVEVARRVPPALSSRLRRRLWPMAQGLWISTGGRHHAACGGAYGRWLMAYGYRRRDTIKPPVAALMADGSRLMDIDGETTHHNDINESSLSVSRRRRRMAR